MPLPEQFEEFYRAGSLAIAELEIAERRKQNASDEPKVPPKAKDPFPWQKRLSARVIGGDWPRAIALPTAVGKTNCIDIAVFALACNPQANPRRILFVVDRRIVVDQAYDHSKKLAAVLQAAKSGILKTVADAHRTIADDDRPLDVYALRGGMYRETAWTRSPLQPTIIASTVDQVGSRLLFRGYGVSDSMKPVHAGLVGNDALILLDEAHCARPFDQTVQAVENYRNWHPGTAPFRFVSITATPSDSVEKFEADAEDLAHKVLGKRLNAAKPATLVVAEKAKGKNGTDALVKVLKDQATKLATRSACVGIIVNRVRTARDLAKALGEDAVLLTGRMRPLDRDRLFREKLQPLLSNAEGTPPKFVVGTQCLECGADFDFHALVTECASLDALRQRFGRLNRVANRDTAEAVIVIRGDETEDTTEDPVYGPSLANTWKWLKCQGEVVDFGINAFKQTLATVSADELATLNAPTQDAPGLFPAHLDCWVQTNPIPTPDPDPAPFLHGPKKPSQPDVQVVFRNDLGDKPELWAAIVALVPPSSSEAVAVPISTFKKWLAGELVHDDSSDVEGEATEPEEKAEPVAKMALAWRGPEKSVIVDDVDKVNPNAVYLVRTQDETAPLLGDFPFGLTDDAEVAFQRSRDKALLRLPDCNLNEDDEEFETKLTAAIEAIKDGATEWQTVAIEGLLKPKLRDAEPHPVRGWVVTGKRRLGRFDPTFLDDGEPAESYRGRAVTLEDHSQGVAYFARRFARGCHLDADLYAQAGLWHDLGKLNPRFQAMLKLASPRTALGQPLAKSERMPKTPQERDAARAIHGYPKGARHELLSAAMVAGKTDDDLLLHLIATHHGSGRPFANPVEDDTATKFVPNFLDTAFDHREARQDIAGWNAELPERFWRMVHAHGWWGLAYREAIFRLADHAQSRCEQERDWTLTCEPTAVKPFPAKAAKPEMHAMPLPGLDGANPLGFLAALGTLMICEQIAATPGAPDWLKSGVKLSWGLPNKPQTPVLHMMGYLFSIEEFISALHQYLPHAVSAHPMVDAVAILTSIVKEKQNALPLPQQIQQASKIIEPSCRSKYDWLTCLMCELAPEDTSQLQITRRDHGLGNLHSVLEKTEAEHLRRAIFQVWDYADGLANQSFHWEPTEDRRHACQWNMPTEDPTRKRRGGMLGANRLALEAWPLFPSFAVSGEASTRGFHGFRMFNTFWTWPLWTTPQSSAVIASLMSLKRLHTKVPTDRPIVAAAFRSQRILVGKTPNLTAATRVF
ncbi:hypothetical protein BH11PLA2_BH11PLA2_43370 [soil metagenome]